MKNIIQLIKNFGIIFLILFLIASIATFGQIGEEAPEEVAISTLVQEIGDGKVKTIEIQGDVLHITLNDENGTKQDVKKEFGESVSEMLSNYGVTAEQIKEIELSVKKESGWAFWLKSLAPYMFPFLLIGGLIYFMSRQVSGVNNRAM